METRVNRAIVEELDSDYEILSELGRGGVSIVYLARDRHLGRDVAIKVIRDAYADDPEALARLEREARTLARLNHPGIQVIHAAKRLPGGGLALVVQHIRGMTLKEALLRDGPFPADRATRVLADVAEALDYLATNGVVHRDIKPENIYIDEATGRAILSDFGIAKAVDHATDVTLAGTVIGTPAYMSPEQIDGAELDARSDLYSLGMVGYEILVGRRPWDGENLYSIIYKQKHEPLPPLESIRPDVPERLRRAIEGAIVKDRNLRWPTPRDFLDALGATPGAVIAPLPSINGARYAPPDDTAHHDSLAATIPVRIEPHPSPMPILLAGPSRWRQAASATVLLLIVGGGAAVFAAMSRSSTNPFPSPRPDPALTHTIDAPALMTSPGTPAKTDPAPPWAERRATISDAASSPPLDGTAESLASTDGLAISSAVAGNPIELVSQTTLRPDLQPERPQLLPAGGSTPAAQATDARSSERDGATAPRQPNEGEPASTPADRPPRYASTPAAPQPIAISEPLIAPLDLTRGDTTGTTRPGGVPLPSFLQGFTPPAIGPVEPPPPRRADDPATAASSSRADGPRTAPTLANASEVARAIKDFYPPVLKAAGIGGTVLVAVAVDERGIVTERSVSSSSGSRLLDEAALRVAERMRFVPATTGGNPVRARAVVPIVFSAQPE
jgi:TonB family protein